MSAASTASSQQELTSAEQSDNRELVKAARGSYRTLAAVPLAATVVATITVAVEIARTAAREKVGQAKSRRRSRTPANSSAVPVALAVVRLRGARQGNNRGCDDKSCGSQCDTHSSCPLGSRPWPCIFSIAEYRLGRHHLVTMAHAAFGAWTTLAVAVRRARDFRFAEDRGWNRSSDQ